MSSLPNSNESLTNWERLDAMTDEDIDLSDTPEMFAKAVIWRGSDRNKAKTTGTFRKPVNGMNKL
ncbi:MAG: hypothetical protein ACE5FD_00530 [Anaerolineae bacterium]